VLSPSPIATRTTSLPGPQWLWVVEGQHSGDDSSWLAGCDAYQMVPLHVLQRTYVRTILLNVTTFDWKSAHMCTEKREFWEDTGQPVERRRMQGNTYVRTQGHFREPSPQDVALRGVMQALVVVSKTLADIVVAIPAVDLRR
jgi:hypothetical protein